MEKHELTLSTLGKTWLIDLDGTILKHNGYLEDGRDSVLKNAIEFLSKIPQRDVIIILTSRRKEYRKNTEEFLKEAGIRYDAIFFDLPCGERILINDYKPSGLKTAFSINVKRDIADLPELFEDPSI